jgi:molybdenum cofactor cytidylyltransferase
MKHPSAEPGPASQVKRIAATILAAGCSSRMGTLKPMLKLGDQTILERAISVFQDFGIEDVIVVVGRRANEVISQVENCRARAITNEQFERGMFSSVQAGVNALRPESEAFFVLPVDIPLVSTQTIRDLLEAYRGGKSKIVVPAFRGRRGHPPLISASYRNEILSYSGGDGLRGFFRKHDRDLEQVEVADEMILFDLDTPADYQALVARFRSVAPRGCSPG